MRNFEKFVNSDKRFALIKNPCNGLDIKWGEIKTTMELDLKMNFIRLGLFLQTQ